MNKTNKQIYVAKISGFVVRHKYTKKYREKFSIECVYIDNEEKNENSYFIRSLRTKLKLDKIDETIEIKSIEKIKQIGLNANIN